MTPVLRGITVMEITLGTNLAICERSTFPVLHPLFDLADDLSVARTLIIAVDRFFLHLRNVRMSGYARKHDSYDGDPGDIGPESCSAPFRLESLRLRSETPDAPYGCSDHKAVLCRRFRR